jgi:hypothetical protein
MSEATPELLPHQSAVRVTLWPDRLHVVATDEIPHLRGSGLLMEDEPDGEAMTPPPAGGKAPKAGADGGSEKTKETS